MIPKILKDWKILLLLVLVIGSILLVLPLQQGGVAVRSVSQNSPLSGKLLPGETLEWINEKTIKTPEDVYAFDTFTGTLRFTHNGKLTLAEIEKPGLGITVMGKPSTRINFGLDLIGGTKVLLEAVEKNVTNDIIEQTIATLQTRINVYGLREVKIQAVTDVSGGRYVQLEMAGGTQKEIEELLAKQGKFDAKIPRYIRMANGTGTLLNETLRFTESGLAVAGTIVPLNGTFGLSGIEWKYINSTDDVTVVMATVYTGSDIRSVCLTEQAGICTSRVQRVSGGYEFAFQITTTEVAAEKFATVTKGIPILPSGRETRLESPIIFFLDGNAVTELTISSDLAGRALVDPSITGFRTTRDDALKEKLTLQSILQSGALPVQLRVAKIDTVSATLGREFVQTAAISGVLAVFAVSLVIMARYRRWKIIFPVIMTSFSEIIIIIGVLALIGYTLDLAAIAGIIATIGTSVDAQIMLIDELLAGTKLYTVRQRVQRAFFMIFGSAGTVMAAMIPLAVIGIGVMRGFAIVTILGVLIGVAVTRPAFARVAERIMEKEMEK